MRSKRVGTQSKILRCIRCPFRVLARARDLYMQSLTATGGGGGGVSYGNAMGCPTPQISSLPRSSSANSGFRTADEQLWDLMKLGKTEAELRRTRSSRPIGGGGAVAPPVPRSRTVAYGRIDEDKAFELGDDDKLGLLVYPRSRSYAASTRVKLLP